MRTRLSRAAVVPMVLTAATALACNGPSSPEGDRALGIVVAGVVLAPVVVLATAGLIVFWLMTRPS